MGAARALPQPLRAIAGWRGRAVAEAEERGVEAAKGTAVDLGKLTGPAFRADPKTLSIDKFHPSDRGYQLWAEALTPALRDAAAAIR
jgi:lysophospholipase L1-like esterase